MSSTVAEILEVAVNVEVEPSRVVEALKLGSAASMENVDDYYEAPAGG